MKKYPQKSAYNSPWSIRIKIKLMLWEFVWVFLCKWTPKPVNAWRIFWLKIFGAKISGRPFVHQRAIIKMPWHLIMHDRACLGERSNVYSLGTIEIGEHATVAQEVYLCTGTHDFNSSTMNLITAPIFIKKHSFIGARAIILPGVTIGEYAIVGAGSIVTKNIGNSHIVAGNPARIIGLRE